MASNLHPISWVTNWGILADTMETEEGKFYLFLSFSFFLSKFFLSFRQSFYVDSIAFCTKRCLRQG